MVVFVIMVIDFWNSAFMFFGVVLVTGCNLFAFFDFKLFFILGQQVILFLFH